MSDCILDTSVLIDILRKNPRALTWHTSLGSKRVAITPIVWFEIVEGARNTIERGQILRFLKQFRIEHSTPDDHRWAMLQFAHYHLSHGAEWVDVMIASVAVRLDAPLYTMNIKHYAPLPGVDARKPY